MLTGHRANSATSAVDVAQAVKLIQDRGRIRATMTEKAVITYRHVASAAAAAAAAHTSVLDVDSSGTMRAGWVQPQLHLAARHPASFRPS